MDWIERAEIRQKQRLVYQDEAEKIKAEVVEQNSANLKSFVKELCVVLDRVKDLTPSEKKPCLDVGYDFDEEKKAYNFFGSAHILKTTWVTYFTGRKTKALYRRKCIVHITDEPNVLKLSLYEEKHKGVKKSNTKSKYYLSAGNAKFSKFKINISKLSDNTILDFASWLAFRSKSDTFSKSLEHKGF